MWHVWCVVLKRPTTERQQEATHGNKCNTCIRQKWQSSQMKDSTLASNSGCRCVLNEGRIRVRQRLYLRLRHFCQGIVTNMSGIGQNWIRWRSYLYWMKVMLMLKKHYAKTTEMIHSYLTSIIIIYINRSECVCLFVCMFICLCIFVCVSVCLCICLSVGFLTVCLFVYVFAKESEKRVSNGGK